MTIGRSRPLQSIYRSAGRAARRAGSAAVRVNLDTTPVQLHTKPFQNRCHRGEEFFVLSGTCPIGGGSAFPSLPWPAVIGEAVAPLYHWCPGDGWHPGWE